MLVGFLEGVALLCIPTAYTLYLEYTAVSAFAASTVRCRSRGCVGPNENCLLLLLFAPLVDAAPSSRLIPVTPREALGTLVRHGPSYSEGFRRATSASAISYLC